MCFSIKSEKTFSNGTSVTHGIWAVQPPGQEKQLQQTIDFTQEQHHQED